MNAPVVTAARSSVAPAHLLSPLSPDEIRHAVAIAQASPHFNEKTRFETIELLEPPKATVRSWSPGVPFGRQARVTLFQADRVGVTRLTVSLNDERIISAVHLPMPRTSVRRSTIVSSSICWTSASVGIAPL